jgi:hypothetical protein
MIQEAKTRGVKKIKLWSDNGPHFHCTSLFDAISAMEKKFGIELEIDFFEVGEGKSDLDRHFGSTKQSIRTRVRNGKGLNGSLEELLTAVAECTTNTRVYEIQPERKQKEEFYHSYEGTNPMRSVRLVKEVVQCQTNEKLVGSLATGEEFFRYEFGAALLKTRKGSKSVSTEEVSATPSVGVEVVQEVASTTTSSSTATISSPSPPPPPPPSSSSSSSSKNCSICGKSSGKSQRHRACMAKERELKVRQPFSLLRYYEFTYLSSLGRKSKGCSQRNSRSRICIQSAQGSRSSRGPFHLAPS